jgi:hypothetical protein
MDKLIITIISIGLTAATIGIGGDYLSGYYMRAQAKVKAAAWISDAAQIATAAKQAGTLTSDGGDDFSAGAASYLVPRYMADLPKRDGNYVFQPALLWSTTFSYPYYDTDANLIMATVENAQVCEEIQKLANRGSATLTRYTSEIDLQLGFYGTFTITMNSICVWIDNDGDTAYDGIGTDTYYFISRVL